MSDVRRQRTYFDDQNLEPVQRCFALCLPCGIHCIMLAVTSLPYDVATAKVFGQIRSQLEEAGNVLPDADLQIAATAIYHDIELVSGNLRHLARIPKLKLNPVLSNARSESDS